MAEKIRVPSTVPLAGLLGILDDIRARVAAGDSFEGSITYGMPAAEDADPMSFDVVTTYRIGNTDGQGGMRFIGEWAER